MERIVGNELVLEVRSRSIIRHQGGVLGVHLAERTRGFQGIGIVDALEQSLGQYAGYFGGLDGRNRRRVASDYTLKILFGLLLEGYRFVF